MDIVSKWSAEGNQVRVTDLLPGGCHLRLDHWLFKQLTVLRIGRVAIPHTLHILTWRSLLAGDPARHPRAGEHYLVLVENGVADSGHEHHRDQEGNKAAVGHGVLRIFDQELGEGEGR